MVATVKDRAKTGLEAFLPTVPNSQPLAPRARAETTPANTNTRRKRGAQRAAPPRETVPYETQDSRRAKTVRMGQARMVNAIRAIRLIKNLSARNYDWHEGEPAAMKKVLQEQINDAFAAFEKTVRVRPEEVFNIDRLIQQT